MATASLRAIAKNIYPTTDGKPMAETDWHRELMIALIQMLKGFYESLANVYVSGNLLIFYEPGNKTGPRRLRGQGGRQTRSAQLPALGRGQGA